MPLQPLGMSLLHPAWIVPVPPSAVMPDMIVVVVAIALTPSWRECDPVRMGRVEPVRIVVVPPVCVVPYVLFVVVAPRSQLSPDLGMHLQKSFEIGMAVAPSLVVNQLRIVSELT